MFEKFGEFDSAEELNRAAKAQREEGDNEAILAIAEENGIDKEDAEDYIDGVTDEFVTALMAAVGKIKVEAEELQLKGILADWKDTITAMCMDETRMQSAVRRKNKSMAECMSALIRFAFENKVHVSDKIVNITKVKHNGKEEAMKKPLYLGIPSKAEVEKIIREYYLG